MRFDEKQLMDHFDQDKEMISELVEVFEPSFQESFSALKESLSANDAKNVELHAHTIKGMVGNFFAEEIKQAAFALEKMGKEASLNGHEPFMDKMEKELPELLKELRQFCE